MKKTVLAFLFSFSSHAFCCEVALPHQLIILNSKDSAPFETKGCESKVNEVLFETLTGMQGRITSGQLTEIMASKGHTLSVTPHILHVQQLKNIIREQLPIPAGSQVKDIRTSDIKSTLSLATGDRIEVLCENCEFGNDQSMTLNILGFTGETKTLGVQVDFKKMVKSYKLTSPLNSFADIPKQILEEQFVESIPHTDLVTDLSILKFYKTNKPVKSGSLLKMSDLGATNLVKAGLLTEVIMENELVRIKTSGISRNNGSFGDTVEVFHPQKNKKYLGKVVDINKVLVEL